MSKPWNTELEIASQPGIWAGWANPLTQTASEIRTWIIARDPDVIWLCGAGTSAFIGDALATGLYGRLAGIPVRAIPSTDLVARPSDYIREGQRPLVISFGRSGDSSESIGTLDILDRLAPNADRLHITCNKDSALATRPSAGLAHQRVIVLPDACHDRGFAMTSSYTTMLLTALACLSDTPLEQIADNLTGLADQASAFLESDLAVPRSKRAVFLGAGPFLGTARESALKVLELTAGRVVTSWDSTLGFRHGPKAIVDDNTVVIVFLSNDVLTRKYDADIVDEIRKQFPVSTVLSVGARQEGHPAPDIALNAHDEDIWNTALYILVAQRLSVAWSKDLGLNVDDPFEGGNLTRVVSNVRLYT